MARVALEKKLEEVHLNNWGFRYVAETSGKPREDLCLLCSMYKENIACVRHYTSIGKTKYVEPANVLDCDSERRPEPIYWRRINGKSST